MDTKERTLQRTTIQGVRVDELPPHWAKLVGVADDEELIVQIIPKRLAWDRLELAMDALGEQATKQGLTEEMLDDILQEIRDERRREYADRS